MTRLDSRRLREQVSLQAPDTLPNGRGGRTPNPATGGWVEIAKPWVEPIALRGDEALRIVVERRRQLWRITMRYRDDITPGHRIVFGSTPIDITAVAPDRAGGAVVVSGESGVTL